MIISGFQPLSLLDYPGVISSIIFTQGCALKCVYCHNPELIPIQTAPTAQTIPEEKILAYLDQRQKMIEGVVVTGGEPTLHPDLPEFLQKLKQRNLLVKLDTNGIHPRVVERLIQEKLVDFFAMDLKHQWNRYAEVTRVEKESILTNIRTTFDLIQSSGVAHEFRTTVYPALHAAEDLKRIADQLKEHERYALQAIRYDKTFVSDLAQVPPLDLERIANEIRAEHPTLMIEVRA